jgi:hypothetical protein
MREFKPTDAAMTAKHHDRERAIRRALRIGIGVVDISQIFAVSLVQPESDGFAGREKSLGRKEGKRKETG